MAAHSNRSPSPMSSRPINPNSRTSEIYSTTRRSFNGNNPFAKPSALANPRRFDPMTPANSPSDFSRRRSVGKEGSGPCLRNCEEKENDEKDQFPKMSKLQSPSPAKGSKSFMAPTISAASKFTPSPRKKALVERNDPVRTSISLYEGKAMFFSNASEDLEPKTEMGYNQNQKTLNSLDLKFADSEKKESVYVFKPSKKVTFLDVPQDSQNANESFSDSDSLKMEPSSKHNNISCSSFSPSIAPLDADPSMPPYDPKTNYLSPRPQFLYYKPNPRLNKEKGMDTNEFNPLEDDSFMKEIMSDNFSSDSEGTQDSEKEKMEAIASADMLMGFEDDLYLYEEVSEKEKLEAIASADMVMGLEFLEDDLHEDDHVSVDSEKEKLEAIASADMFEGLEFSEDDLLHDSQDSEKAKLEAIASADRVMGLDETNDDDLLYVQKNEKKSWGFSRLMCFSMVMMMLLMAACISISVTRSPSFEEFGFKDLSFSDLGNLYHQSRVAATNAKVAKVNFHRLARLINHLTVNCVSFISKVASELGKGEKTIGPLKYMNLSDLQKDSWDGRHFLNNNEVSEDLAENVEDDDEFDEELDTAMEIFEEEEAYEDSDESFENEIDTQEDDDVSGSEEKMSTDSSELDSEYSEDTQNQREIVVPSISAADQLAAIIPQDQESELEAEIEIVPSETVEIEKSDGETNRGSATTLLDQDSPSSEVDSVTESVQNSIIIPESPPSEEDKFLAHYAMEISSFFAALLGVAVFIYQYKTIPSLANKQKEYEFSNIKQQMYQEKAFSQKWQTEVDDAIGESSCPSEMSSFLKSASYSKKEMRGASEVRSLERKTRRYHSNRESLASSSSEFTTGSPSYGSFTTFEKIPIKNANGDEEIITPVRRSSRIRNHQFTSP